MNINSKCIVCQHNCESQSNHDKNSVFYCCPICGRYEITASQLVKKSVFRNHIASYLYYNRFQIDNPLESRYHTTMAREMIEKYKEEQLHRGIKVFPVFMDEKIIESWYPKSFSERVDKILLMLDSLTPHIGMQITLSFQEMLSLLFVDRIDDCQGQLERRDDSDMVEEASYMLNYLSNSEYVNYVLPLTEDEAADITLSPKGYSRVDLLQKNTSNGKDVLVAMKFGEETALLREEIRKGISEAGYHAVYIDEVQHNDFITPELLKHIRDSKFIVADLTHQNNGAYFEEGYAMGLGKPVIQLCKAGVNLHFDIAQKNTIIWNTEAEIPERLKGRIIATID